MAIVNFRQILQRLSPHVRPGTANPVAAFKKTFLPSAQEGANRRMRVFGTTSKLPAIATAAAIAAGGALTLPGAAAAPAAAAGENVLQTALRYVASPSTSLRAIAKGIAGTAGFVETGNAIQALATGNPGALVPSNYQSATILGSSFFPGAAHIAAVLGFIGRGTKAGAAAVGNELYDFAQEIPRPHVPEAVETAYDYAVDAGSNAFDYLQSIPERIGDLNPFGGGISLPPIAANVNLGAASEYATLAALGGLAGYYFGRRKRKHKNKKRKRSRK